MRGETNISKAETQSQWIVWKEHHFMHLKWATIIPVDTRCTGKWAASPGGLKSGIREQKILSELKTNTAGVIWVRQLKSWNKLPKTVLHLYFNDSLSRSTSDLAKRKFGRTGTLDLYNANADNFRYPVVSNVSNAPQRRIMSPIRVTSLQVTLFD